MDTRLAGGSFTLQSNKGVLNEHVESMYIPKVGLVGKDAPPTAFPKKWHMPKATKHAVIKRKKDIHKHPVYQTSVSQAHNIF